MIIGVTGSISSGKTTITNVISENADFKIYNMADPLKKIGEIFGFTKEQLYGTQEQKLEIHPYWGISARTFLQKMGTEIFRVRLKQDIPEMKIESTVWIELFRLFYKNNPGNYVIGDVRFVDEANMIKQLGGVIIKTVRNDITKGDEQKHVSELEIDAINEDILVDNNKLSKDEAKKLVIDYIGKELFLRI
jgi:hypothetical protein